MTKITQKFDQEKSNHPASVGDFVSINDLAPLPVLQAPLKFSQNVQPECVTILATYRCNASCAECCFESNPNIKHRMSKRELIDLIDQVHIELPHVKYVVLSGGEVTLLREDLIAAISQLTEHGLGSRIVSNGHWGRSEDSAKWWISKFLDSGLSELNLSTGDEHLEYVPLDSIARAAYYAVKEGILTLISVEGKDNARFKMTDLQGHPLFAEILASDEMRQRFILLTNIWIPFHNDRFIPNDNVKEKYEPCDNIFTNFVINPYGNIMSCCGLTMEYIPEHKIGNVTLHHLCEMYTNQYNDLLKLWIWLDGTRFIFDLAVKRNGLNVDLISPHMCSICAQLYKDNSLRSVVTGLLEENMQQIIFRATVKAKMTGRSLI